jgi:hypothetical protein
MSRQGRGDPTFYEFIKFKTTLIQAKENFMTPVAFSLPASTRHRFQATTPKKLDIDLFIC